VLSAAPYLITGSNEYGYQYFRYTATSHNAKGAVRVNIRLNTTNAYVQVGLATNCRFNNTVRLDARTWAIGMSSSALHEDGLIVRVYGYDAASFTISVR
jgi:hypothetical protein